MERGRRQFLVRVSGRVCFKVRPRSCPLPVRPAPYPASSVSVRDGRARRPRSCPQPVRPAPYPPSSVSVPDGRARRPRSSPQPVRPAPYPASSVSVPDGRARRPRSCPPPFHPFAQHPNHMVFSQKRDEYVSGLGLQQEIVVSFRECLGFVFSIISSFFGGVT